MAQKILRFLHLFIIFIFQELFVDHFSWSSNFLDKNKLLLMSLCWNTIRFTKLKVPEYSVKLQALKGVPSNMKPMHASGLGFSHPCKSHIIGWYLNIPRGFWFLSKAPSFHMHESVATKSWKSGLPININPSVIVWYVLGNKSTLGTTEYAKASNFFPWRMLGTRVWNSWCHQVKMTHSSAQISWV